MSGAVVIGANGQLGRDLVARLPFSVQALTRADVDLTDHDRLRECLSSLRPHIVFNCAAYNFVDKAETEPAIAFAVNAIGPYHLARICQDLGCILVHFSTDYVFGLDSHRQQPWETTDTPGPISTYGASKLAGEYAVRSNCQRHFVIRTCGLYGVWGSGGKGGNFVETMLRVAGQGKPLRVVADQHCTPSYTVDVAAAAIALAATSHYGLYHITNDGATTWHDLAAETFRLAGITADLTPITTREYNAPAARPAYSVLSLASLESAGVARPRLWREALAAYLTERASRATA